MPRDVSSRLGVGWAGLLVAALAVLAALFRPIRQHYFSKFPGSSTGTSILTVFATNAFDWSSSTTPAPLSAAAVLVKEILAGKGDLPRGLESAILTAADEDGADERVVDVHVGPVRGLISMRVLREVQRLCSSSPSSGDGGGGLGCDPNEVDPEFGTTPLHLAELWGSGELRDYLLSIGADPEKYDTVGRQPRNMTFQAFSTNSKKAGAARLPHGADPEDRCEIPEVNIPLFPRSDVDAMSTASEKLEAAREWQTSAISALSEVRRLVSEGEPVMVRNVLAWLQQDESFHRGGGGGGGGVVGGQPAALKYPNAAAFAAAWGHRPVDVGSVPYAKNFDLVNEKTTLQGYMAASSAAASVSAGEDGTSPPNYVFQVDVEACVEGRDILGRVVEAALPSSGNRPMVCPPASGIRGMESVHYYLGGRWTGAPFHIHSDAINLAVGGKKKWWVVTPRSAVWSRRHIREYAEERKGGPRKEPGEGAGAAGSAEEDRPMECIQRAGDLVYVPGDWGHAAMNLEDDTFG